MLFLFAILCDGSVQNMIPASYMNITLRVRGTVGQQRLCQRELVELFNLQQTDSKLQLAYLAQHPIRPRHIYEPHSRALGLQRI